MTASPLYELGVTVKVLGIVSKSAVRKQVTGEVRKVDGAQVLVVYKDVFNRWKKRWYHVLAKDIQTLDGPDPEVEVVIPDEAHPQPEADVLYAVDFIGEANADAPPAYEDIYPIELQN